MVKVSKKRRSAGVVKQCFVARVIKGNDSYLSVSQVQFLRYTTLNKNLLALFPIITDPRIRKDKNIVYGRLEHLRVGLIFPRNCETQSKF